MINYVALGNRIRNFRKQKGWTQAELAEKVHISNTTMSHIEVGSNKSETNTIVNIANILGVSLDMLLCDSLYSSGKAYDYYINETLQGCTDDEKRFINRVLPELLEAYRDAKKQKYEEE